LGERHLRVYSDNVSSTVIVVVLTERASAAV